ncbi:MAG TPA: hypothetical protein VKF36_25615 [Syntrophorhabdales bacterium]|nr:hypothetical protein [Syntrophorhabdales bacterium]
MAWTSEKKHTIQHALILLSLSALVLVVLGRSTTVDVDFWGYIAFGRLFWHSNSFPYQDIFTYLPTTGQWIYHEWLTGTILYPIYTFAGDPGVIILRDLVALATLAFLYLAARIRKSHRASALFWLVLISGFLGMGYWAVVRAQTFTYLFTALTIYVLERSRWKGQRSLLLILVPIQIIWCNMHGGFLAGLGIAFLYLIGDAFSHRTYWPYLPVLLLLVLSSLANPYGVDYWTYLFHAITLPRRDITEWASILTAYQTHTMSLSLIFYYMFIGIFSLRMLFWWNWQEITPILVLSVTFLLGLEHVRHQVFFLMVTAVYLPGLIQPYIKDLQARSTSLGARLRQNLSAVFLRSTRMTRAFITAVPILLFCVILGSSSFSLMIPSYQKGVIIYYPTGALEYIRRNHLSGNILTEFMWGEYLIWNLGPRMKVALDGRYETVYQGHVANQYFDYMKGKEKEFLDTYAHDMVLFKPDSPPVDSIRSNPDWKGVYEDMGSILFMKARTPMPSL